jgi:SAM-dependent methyltransferase
MFGEKLDYEILRMMAHKRNIATEEDMDVRASQQPLRSADAGVTRLRTHIERFDGLFPIDPGLRYLDIGCGDGELTLGLAMLGCRHVTGIDSVPRNIAAAESYARRLGVDSTARFIRADINNWVPLEKYDVLLSFDALEHIDNPKHFLRKVADFLAQDGVLILGFGPLFHSPFGDHMSPFFRMRIPWRGVLFSEKAVLRVRREYYRPTDVAERYQDIVGGLNLMRYSEFLRYVRETGWDFSYLALNPRLKRLPVIRRASAALTRVPVVRDYCVFSVYAIMRRSSVARA